MERCFQSVKGKVDRIIAVDGPYMEFQHESTFSTDGCLAMAHRYADIVIEGREWEDQVTKRNSYLQSCDYILQIDADEEWFGGIRDLKEKVYSIDLETAHERYYIKSKAPRIIRWVDGMHYFKRHSQIIVGDTIISPHNHDKFPEYKFGKILHRPHVRPHKRILEKGNYYRTRAENREEILDGKYI